MNEEDPKCAVSIGSHGELVLTGTDRAALARVLTTMQEVRVVVPPETRAENPLPDVPAPAPPPEPARKKKRRKPPNPSSDDRPFYAVFRDDKKRVVHVTKPRKLWSEARGDAHHAAKKLATAARTAVIYDGPRPAQQRGSKLERARTAWHTA